MYIANFYLSGGVRPGDTVRDLPAEEIERLLKLGAIREVKAPSPAPKAELTVPATDPEQEIDVSEGIVKPKKTGRRKAK